MLRHISLHMLSRGYQPSWQGEKVHNRTTREIEIDDTAFPVYGESKWTWKLARSICFIPEEIRAGHSLL